MSDWEWWFTSEWGRDRILRDEVEALQASAASTAAHSARMRSQLARLEGSLETRLSALSAAFDAYVELGDVREQLTAYADTGAVRRKVRDAFKTMTEGGRPEPVVDDETEYWLAPATNSVIAILGGGADPDADALAADRQSESSLFVVAAAGGLEHGAAVADRIPALFEQPNDLDAAHRALFSAVALGIYPGALAHLRSTFAAVATAQDPTDTLAWVAEQTNSRDPQTNLEWIESLLSVAPAGTAPTGSPEFSRPPADGDARKIDEGEVSTGVDLRAPQAVAADRLRAVVVEMIEAGTGSEAELLRRARTLRARIESPGAVRTGAGTGAEDEETPTPMVPGATAVREEAINPAVDPDARAELIEWLRPSLLAAADVLGTPVTRTDPVITIQTPGGSMDVTPSGPNSTRQAQVFGNIATEDPSMAKKLIAAGAATGVLAVLALVVALVGQTGLSILLLVAALVTGVVTIRLLLARNTRRREQTEDAARVQQAISDAVRRAQTQQQAEREADAGLQQTYQRVRGRLEQVPT